MTIEQRVKSHPFYNHQGEIAGLRRDPPLVAIDTDSNLPDAAAIRVNGMWFKPVDNGDHRSFERRWKDCVK